MSSHVPKHTGIIGGVLVLLIGAFVGYLYSNQHGGTLPAPKHDALQVFSKDGYLEVPLVKKESISHDTYIFTFKLPDPNAKLGLETGQHILIHAHLPTKNHSEGEDISRKYTPVSKMDHTGTFDLLIKIYRKGVNPIFPDGGVMTQYLETLKEGDKIKISGPKGRLTYNGHGDLTIVKPEERNQKIKVKKLGLIAGGSGITPMYQLIRALLDDPTDETTIHLLFANKGEEDILLKQELEQADLDHRIKVYFTVDKAKEGWIGFEGYVNPEMIKKTMPEPDQDVLICHCGTKMMNQMVVRQLIELGYKEENIFKF